MRNQETLKKIEEFGLHLMLVVPDELTLKILGPKQWNYKILIGQCRELGYSECVGC
jgi:hypothetical protein